MSSNPPLIRAAILGALATLVVPLILCVWVLITNDGVLTDGTPDDAPRRAAVVFISLAPVLVVVIFLGILALSCLLRARQAVNKRMAIFIVVSVSLIGATFFGYNGYKDFGMEDAIISFAIFSLFFHSSIGIGATVWWFIYHRRWNHSS